MKKIFKYLTHTPDSIVSIQEGFKVVFFGTQYGILNTWAEVNPLAQLTRWKLRKVDITAFPNWDELITLRKGSVFLGGMRDSHPTIKYYLWFLEPEDSTEMEEQGYALGDTGWEIPTESAVHVGMIFDNDKTKGIVVHIYRFK